MVMPYRQIGFHDHHANNVGGLSAAIASGVASASGALPPGGTIGQALLKLSGTNYDVGWDDIEAMATAEMDSTLVLHPDGAGGVEFSAAASGSGGGFAVGTMLQNEVKGWPCQYDIGAGFDVVTQNQWWDDEGTPTTKATAVPVSGEAGLDAKFTEVIKCVTDAADEGFVQRYTYADEPRIKSGVHISALVWVATTAGGSGITAQLRNSDASFTAGTAIATNGDWSLVAVEDHVCAGTYVELVVTKDASGTFYAGGPITVMVGADAIALPPRKGVYRHIDDGVTVKTLTGIGDEDTWTDIDCTSATSPLAYMGHYTLTMFEDTTNDVFELFTRRNGSAEGKGSFNSRGKVYGTSGFIRDYHGQFQILLDDGQVFEYNLDRGAGSGTLNFGLIGQIGWWEWE